jgi:DNA-binding response OmpR family regulator
VNCGGKNVPAVVAQEAAEPSGQAAPPRILIIDDSQPTANALAAVLRRAAYQTAVAYRGNEGIEQARCGSFDAAVVDIHLPDLSGLVVSQKLREILGPQTPIIVLSGDTSMTTLNSLPHVGATYFFSKPVNASHLLERLKEWLAPARGS